MSKQRGLILMTLGLCAALLAERVHASPWMRAQGEHGLSVGLGYSTADSYWDRDSKLRRDDCRSNDYVGWLHYEYGYSYYRTFFANSVVVSEQCGDSERSGIPHLQLGMRGRLDVYRNGRTWQLAVTLPVQGDLDDDSKPGNGQVALDAGLFFRFLPDPYKDPLIEQRKGIWEWAVGTRLWGGGLAHNLWSHLKWDRQLSAWRFGAELSATYAFGGGDQRFAPGVANDSKSTDFDEINLRFTLSRQVSKNTSLMVGYGRDLWGRNTGQDDTLLLGLSYSRAD